MKYVGIITAMIEELEAVKKLMDKDIKMKTVNGIEVIMGKIKGIDCILVQCNAGKVNAARVTQILIDSFEIEYMINVGVAGALNYKVKVGDVIIGEKVVQHDFDITAFRHSKGYVPGVGNEALSDRNLIETFRKAVGNIKEGSYNVIVGTIATGDIFVTEVAMKDRIASQFKADCVEMEGAAIAQICILSNIPFIVIRSISDTPNGNNEKDYSKNINLAAKRCADIINEFFNIESHDEDEY